MDKILEHYRNVVELVSNRTKSRVLVYHHPFLSHLSIWLEVDVLHPDASLYFAYSHQNEVYSGDSLLEAVQSLHG